MQRFRNRIICAVIIAIITVFLSFDTLAEETVKKCKSGENQDIEQRYNLKLEKISTNQYKISMNGDPNDIDNAIFEVVGTTEYNGTTGGSLTQAASTIGQIKKNQPAFFNARPATTTNGNILAIKVKLVAGSTMLSDCDYNGTLVIKEFGEAKSTSIYSGNNEKENVNSVHHTGSICYNFFNGIWNATQFKGIKKADFDSYNYKAVSSLYVDGTPAQAIYNNTLSYCNSAKISVGAEYTEENLANMIGNTITYIKSQTKVVGNGSQTFAQLFNDIKQKAIASGNNKTGKEAKDDSLTCDWQLTSSSGDPLDYYKNKDYFYKEEKVDSIKVQYTYNYAPGDTQKSTSKEVCKRTCSEAVKVEYGPPIASKAGLCFEYKVKVTSYVQCKADIVLSPPEAETSYCSPDPYCHHKDFLWEGNQAGPTEEFDECIKKCDGGKYTSKCSTKCYKEIYKDSKVKLALNYETSVQKLSLSDEVNKCIQSSTDGGCYYWSGDQIYWKSKYQEGKDFSNNIKALGRWYRDVNYYTGDVGEGLEYDVSSNGIKTQKQANSSSGHCQDICSWKTGVCTKGKYLNPQSALDDYQNNLKAYQTAVNQCQASATCSSSTAEYTISINYDTKNEEGATKVTTIKFPYSTNKDEISSKGAGNSNINTATAGNTTILDYNGCYADSKEKNWYLTEWSFPGTYIHNKTGEISFKVPSDTSGWYYENKKFCMPLNAQSVNTKWWEWAKLGNTCFTTAQIIDELNGKTGTSNGYNIKASTNKFGYFDWHFDVKCFYALRNEVCKTDETGCCAPTPSEPKTANGVENYTIRTVDRDNLFPNAQTEGIVDDNSREIGFNWTSKAKILEYKNKNYQVDPEKLIKDIEENADKLYSDNSNLDYQFYLTPSTLNAIRKYNDKYNYGVWNGNTKEINGIMAYSSNLFRSTGSEPVLTNIADSIKRTGCIGVNNDNIGGGSCPSE